MKPEEFKDLSEQEKLEKLRELHEKIQEGEQGVEDLNIEGEITFTVYNEDGEEKKSESQNFKY